MSEIYKRKVKTIQGNGNAGTLSFVLPQASRCHSALIACTYAGGVNTIAAFMALLTGVRVIFGTSNKKWELTGTQLRDWLLKHGTGYDFQGLPNAATIICLPFAPEWLLASVADALALDPVLAKGVITIELDFPATAVTAVVTLKLSDDAGQGNSAGLITQQVVRPVVGGLKVSTGPELKAIGRLLEATFYPDAGNGNQVTPLTLFLGSANVVAHESVSITENNTELFRNGFTPTAAGRTALLYDYQPVQGDMLSHGPNLAVWGSAAFQIEAAAAMAQTMPILLTRLESY